MNTFIRISKGIALWVVMLALLIGPTGATANEAAVAELNALQAQIDALEIVLTESLTLTTAQRNDFNNLVAQIEDEITLRTAVVTSGITMEVIIESGPLATAQVITADRVVNLDFTFTDSFATATRAMILADVVERTAFALQLNEATLASGARVVSSFSGITVPTSLFPAPPAPSVVVAPSTIPEVAGRSNVQSVKIGGSVPDYTITAEVVYGPEPSFEQATFTKLYRFDRPSDTDLLSEALVDLVAQGREEISQDFGLTSAYISSEAVVSIERYEDSDDVPVIFRTSSLGSTGTYTAIEEAYVVLEDSPIPYFGSYSVIEEIQVSTNDVEGADQGESFSVRFMSDQDEVMEFSLAPEYELVRGGRDDGDYYRATGRLEYGFLYSIHGVPVEYVTEGDVTFSGFVDYLEQYFEGIGRNFALSDEDFIAELATFLAANPSIYTVYPTYGSARYPEVSVVESDACYLDREKSVVIGVIEYMLDGMQLSQELEDIIYVSPDIYYVPYDEDRGFGSLVIRTDCDADTGFFPSLP